MKKIEFPIDTPIELLQVGSWPALLIISIRPCVAMWANSAQFWVWRVFGEACLGQVVCGGYR